MAYFGSKSGFFRCDMRAAHTCSRCKQVAAVDGDLWCVGCSAWESIGRELAAGWDQAGCRAIASDLALNSARQIRALRSLGAGLVRAPIGPAPDTPQKEESRLPLERKRKTPPPPLKREASPGELEEDLEEEESEEEVPISHHQPLGEDRHRPPEPEGPPPGRHHQRESRHSDRAGSSRAHHRSDYHTSRSSRQHQSSRRKGRRAGRKHQRLHRLAEDPTLVVHRKISEGELQLSCLYTGREHLDRDIL